MPTTYGMASRWTGETMKAQTLGLFALVNVPFTVLALFWSFIPDPWTYAQLGFQWALFVVWAASAWMDRHKPLECTNADHDYCFERQMATLRQGEGGA